MSTWEDRELPVLHALADAFEAKPDTPLSVQTVARRTGFTQDEVVEALRRLAESKGPYISGSGLIAADGPTRVTGLTQRAEQELAHRRAVGADDHPG